MKTTMLVCIAVAGLLCVIGSVVCQRSEVNQADLDALLPGLVQGCKDNAADIKTGKGSVTIHSIEYSYADGEAKTFETSGTYSVAFDGAKYKISGETLCIKNEQATSELGRKPDTTETYSIACDGERVTELRPYSAAVGSVTGPMRGANGSFLVNRAIARGACPYGGQGVLRIDLYPASFGNDLIDKGLRTVRMEQFGGHECIVVERKVEKTLPDAQKSVITREYWVDPQRGFRVPILREWVEGGGGLAGRALSFESLTTLREDEHGLWVPAKSTYVQYELDGKGGVRVSHRSETSYGLDYRLNIPVAADEMILQVPSNLHLQDVDTQVSP